MRILLYEFISSGGAFAAEQYPPPASLAREGAAMLAALTEDFCKLPDCEVSVLLDARMPWQLPANCQRIEINSADEDRQQLITESARQDWTLLIAPEIDGELLSRCQLVEGQLLGGSLAAIELASDKHLMAEHLLANNISAPEGALIPPGGELPNNFIGVCLLKPCDGAGSQGIEIVFDVEPPPPPRLKPYRFERYYSGLPASCAVLCGPAGHTPLPPCVQYFQSAIDYTYCGGRTLSDPDHVRRAQALALAVIETLPGPLGYYGVDLILGVDPTGAEDVAIEVNPRLTTSYVGLRAMTDDNLAAAMLAVAQGRRPTLSFGKGPVRFSPDGRVSPA